MMTKFTPLAAPKVLAALGALAAFAALPAGAASMAPIDGRYIDSGGFVEITIARCGSSRCGTITKIIKNKPGEPNRDVHNDNPSLRDRPILGIRLITGLKWDDDRWRGEIYNPEDGNTYRAEVRPARGGALEVKGCLAFLCRTRVWPGS